jgi:hypothetical protein
MLGVTIGRQLDFSGATLVSETGRAIDLQRVKLEELVLRWSSKPLGLVDLKDARIARVDDEWPVSSYVARLDGLLYERLTPLEDLSSRLDWLSKTIDGYAPQPYEQLAAVLRRAGRDDAARQVAIAKERRRRGELNRLGRVVNRLLDITVGYGYRVWQGAVWLTCVALLDWGVVAWAKATNHMTSLSERGRPAPQFHAFLYALDSVIPVISLGQRAYWNTLSTVLGWLLVTLILGALTVRLIRD